MPSLSSRSDRPVLGRYELLSELARGGMAVVYLARQVEPEVIERAVVVKRLHVSLAASASLVRGFLDEARTLTNVRHPNVVPILDVVEARAEAFLVLEHVDAMSLAELTEAAKAAGERVPLGVASRVLCDVLAGLHAAHEAKSLRGAPLAIVHRDVSPQNVLVGADGVSRLIDFGIAKAEEREAATTGAVLKGKIGYLAPEQLQGLDIDRRVDVFAAGVVLHELLVGKRLFRGNDHATVMMRVLLDEIPAPSSVRDDLPPELDAVVEKALSRDRDGRYATAAELLEDLARVAPPASPIEVARWLERLCGDALEKKRAELRALVTEPIARRAPGRRGRPLVFVAAFGAAAAVVLGVAFGARAIGRSAAAPPVATSVVASSTASSPPSSPTSSSPIASAPSHAPPSPSTATVASAPTPSSSPRPAATAHPTHPAKTAAPRASEPAPDTPLHGNPYAPRP